MAHSRLGASGMARWKNCPGSVRMTEGLHSPTTEFAAEGTAAHKVGEVAPNHMLAGKTVNKALSAVGDHWIYVTDNGEIMQRERMDPKPTEFFEFFVDQPMLDAVREYVEAIARICAQDKGAQLMVERRFHLSQLHDELWGTSDAVIWLPATQELHVVDYKHGQGVPVEVHGNLQLHYYGLGALLDTGYAADKVVNHVVQPRCPHRDGPHRFEEIDAVDLLDFADMLVEAAYATEHPDAPLNPGDWCRWCPAAAICPKLQEVAVETAKQEFREDLSYDPDKLAETLALVPVIEAWCKSVKEFAEDRAKHGETIPGWKLVDKRATRKWRDEQAVIDTLDQLGITEDEAYSEPKLKTPPQIEKLVPKDKRELLNELVVAESSGVTLAPESDKRQAAKGSAQDDFAESG